MARAPRAARRGSDRAGTAGVRRRAAPPPRIPRGRERRVREPPATPASKRTTGSSCCPRRLWDPSAKSCGSWPCRSGWRATSRTSTCPTSGRMARARRGASASRSGHWRSSTIASVCGPPRRRCNDQRQILPARRTSAVGGGCGQPRSNPLSLPALYAALVRDAVGDFPALRPHRRDVWHAFLVQVAALALDRAGLHEMPDDAGAWRALLLALTPDDPDGTAWAWSRRRSDPRCCKLQVLQRTEDFKNVVVTPDGLDILITNRNHDVETQQASAVRSPSIQSVFAPDRQTQSGYTGPTWYGASRMNGGSGSRPGFGVALR